MPLTTEQQVFLDDYLGSLGKANRPDLSAVEAYHFCADRENADICADLVCRGIKTATCSLKVLYEREGEPVPSNGSLDIIIDWHGKPKALIEVLSVEECRFNDITAEWAAAEGEGDQSLDWWRDAHRKFFNDECTKLGIQFNEDMILILERFRVAYCFQGESA